MASQDESLFIQSAKEFFESRSSTIGLIVLAVIVSLALLAPWVAPRTPMI